METRAPFWSKLAVAAILPVMIAMGCEPQQQAQAGDQHLLRGGQEEFGHYNLVEDWPRPLSESLDGDFDGYTWGSQAAIYAESPNRIWVAQRGLRELPPGNEPWTPGGLADPPLSGTGMDRTEYIIFALDGAGNVVEYWDQHDELFEAPGVNSRGPHKIKMSPYDQDKHIWVIDDQLHVIYKFTYDGEHVMTLGEVGVPGRGPNNFARPTDIAWLPDGTFFISDGYDGTRVAKFDPEGNFLMDWGEAPADPNNPGPNEWNTVHSIAISADRRIYVVDRAHRRMQVFDEDGNFLDMWSTGRYSLPYAHEITIDPVTGEEVIWVADGGTNRILKYDLEGHFLYGWGLEGSDPGKFDGPHSLSTDQEGNLFFAEVFNGRLQKFSPLSDADPSKLVGELLREYTPTQ